MGDGNCMFRAIAHQLYGLDKQHLQLRLTLQEVIQKNAKHYKPLWIGKDNFSTHVKQVHLAGVWGTQVELQATSDLLGVPVYVALLNTKGIYCWNKFKPRKMITEEPVNRMSFPIYPFTVQHLEIGQNNMRNHYDSIIPIFPGSHALQPPIIETHTVTTISVD